MLSTLRPALVLFGALTLVCGVMYPMAVTGIGKAAFADQADGSIVMRDGQAVGSSLIGQSFTAPRYFWGRPSATSPMANNAGGSGGSNLGPTNPALAAAVQGRINALKAADPGNATPVPVDLVTTSGSGLDPHVSVAAAMYQLGRVAAARNLTPGKVRQLLEEHTEAQRFGFLGEPRINVLALNLALDAETAHTGK